jgi:hypothetical protein
MPINVGCDILKIETRLPVYTSGMSKWQNEHCSRVVSTPALYMKGPSFETWPEHQLC